MALLLDARFDMFSGGSATVQIKASGDTHFSGGNVGIGTDTPQTLLNVNSLSGTTYPTLGTASGVIAISINELHGMYLGVDGASGNGWIQAMREDATATAYNLILQPSGGSVGIGTTSPDFALDIEGVDSGVQFQIGRTNTNAGSTWMGF